MLLTQSLFSLPKSLSHPITLLTLPTSRIFGYFFSSLCLASIIGLLLFQLFSKKKLFYNFDIYFPVNAFLTRSPFFNLAASLLFDFCSFDDSLGRCLRILILCYSFFLHFVIRAAYLILLSHFVFFDGDLRSLFYLIPFSLLRFFSKPVEKFFLAAFDSYLNNFSLL